LIASIYLLTFRRFTIAEVIMGSISVRICQVQERAALEECVKVLSTPSQLTTAFQYPGTSDNPKS
jgi:hypothetical protein